MQESIFEKHFAKSLCILGHDTESRTLNRFVGFKLILKPVYDYHNSGSGEIPQFVENRTFYDFVGDKFGQ